MIIGLVDTNDLAGSLLRIMGSEAGTREPIAQQLALVVSVLHDGGGGGGNQPAGVPEAPTDGNLYGRENAAWATVPPAADPTKVLKAGDTMTGELIIQGDQFDAQLTPNGPPAITITTSRATAGLRLGYNTGIEATGPRKEFVTPNGTGFTAYDAAGDRLALGNDPHCLTFANAAGQKINITQNGYNLTLSGAVAIEIVDRYGTGFQTNITLNNGDLVATAITGPNAGKSVNLTFGKWA